VVFASDALKVSGMSRNLAVTFSGKSANDTLWDTLNFFISSIKGAITSFETNESKTN
jgi:hypothetical protein